MVLCLQLGTRDEHFSLLLGAVPTSCGSSMPVTGNNHGSSGGQMGFFLLLPALLCCLHSNSGKCKSGTGVESP